MKSLPVSKSQSEMIQMVLPNDTNTLGNLLGGRLMHWIDIVAAIAGRRHCGHPVVTASMDKLDFLAPVKLGDIVVLKASVNRAFRTSMEIGVKVFAEIVETHDRIHTASAFLTFVALDEYDKPVPVPCIDPQTEEEKRRHQEAGIRREKRIAEK